MKKDLTELVFILDRSGSMSGLEAGYDRRFQLDDCQTEERTRRGFCFNGTVRQLF